MAKNIVICCDGTANQFSKDRTNVVKLFYMLEQETSQQIAYYHPGVGTMEPVGALTTVARKLTRVLGLAFGYGIASDIQNAYTYLMNHYQEGDKVYLFGFSRGSYTARAICSMLSLYGLLSPGNDSMVTYAVRMMFAIQRAEKTKPTKDTHDAVAEYFQLAADFKAAMGRGECKPHFVGVWDTVSSVGWFTDSLKLPFTADNPDIAIGRHAISIDERRAFFRTNRWIPSPAQSVHGPRDLQQVWFAGVHCDVGGGYPEATSGLSKIALEWMVEEAKAAGLLVNLERQNEVLGIRPGGRYVQPDPDGLMHEELKGAWKIAEWIRRPRYDSTTGKTTKQANHGKRRIIPANACVHDSVFLREGGAYAERIKLPAGVQRVYTRSHSSPIAGA
ncbi:MAG: hypothetical protein JWM43_2237 [Acidobacteriaceae bacterium]|nr:hypothetical protein [Acidobacteriaceae bacterium]